MCMELIIIMKGGAEVYISDYIQETDTLSQLEASSSRRFQKQDA